MQERDVPIDGIGLQGQFTLVAPNRASLQSQLERVGELGLEVELTEIDFPRPLFDGEPDPFAAQAAACLDSFGAGLAVIGALACLGARRGRWSHPGASTH